MRAILIDPSDQTIKEVEYDGDFRTIHDLIAAPSRMFEVVGGIPHHDCYVDEEGLLYHGGNPHGYFNLPNSEQQAYAGKGLVLKCDDEGETIGATVSLAEVQELVRWI